MNSKLLLVIVTLIVVFGAFTFLANKSTGPTTLIKQPESMKSQQTTPAVTETNNQVANVILGDSGFVPKDIIIKAGARVIWVNKSGKTATVISNDHPTHRLYPFLNLGEFADGSSVQVVVEKAGKYSYHNHYNASETGTITAE